MNASWRLSVLTVLAGGLVASGMADNAWAKSPRATPGNSGATKFNFANLQTTAPTTGEPSTAATNQARAQLHAIHQQRRAAQAAAMAAAARANANLMARSNRSGYNRGGSSYNRGHHHHRRNR